MPKANRTCHCCGREYYYCPSCPDDRRDPRIYVMWDSELCREIFNVLVNESTKKITTLECKEKLIELGVTKDTILKDSIKKHVGRVMACEEEKIIKTDKLNEECDNISETDIKIENIDTTENKNTKKINRTKKRKSSLKNIENSEVD